MMWNDSWNVKLAIRVIRCHWAFSFTCDPVIILHQELAAEPTPESTEVKGQAPALRDTSQAFRMYFQMYFMGFQKPWKISLDQNLFFILGFNLIFYCWISGNLYLMRWEGKIIQQPKESQSTRAVFQSFQLLCRGSLCAAVWNLCGNCCKLLKQKAAQWKIHDDSGASGDKEKEVKKEKKGKKDKSKDAEEADYDELSEDVFTTSHSTSFVFQVSLKCLKLRILIRSWQSSRHRAPRRRAKRGRIERCSDLWALSLRKFLGDRHWYSEMGRCCGHLTILTKMFIYFYIFLSAGSLFTL